MTRNLIRLGLLFLVYLSVTFAQQPTAPAGDALFLSQDDIPQALRIAPGLVTASNQGTQQTHAFLTAQVINNKQVTQVLQNISVAYTAIKLEDYLKQLQPLVDDKNKGSQYQQYIAQAQKQLADLTANYQKAQKNGRSALDVNKEYVVKNQAAVEEIMVHIRNVKVESLPK